MFFLSRIFVYGVHWTPMQKKPLKPKKKTLKGLKPKHFFKSRFFLLVPPTKRQLVDNLRVCTVSR